MTQRETTELVRIYLHYLINEKYLSFHKAYLFGSYVNGNFTPASDIDVAIVVSDISNDCLETYANLFRLGRKVDISIEPKLTRLKIEF